MSEESERNHIQYMVMTGFREQFYGVMEQMRGVYGMELHEIVVNLQLSVIFNYERAKERALDIHHRQLEYQEVAVLQMIVIIAQEMASAR